MEQFTEVWVICSLQAERSLEAVGEELIPVCVRVAAISDELRVRQVDAPHAVEDVKCVVSRELARNLGQESRKHAVDDGLVHSIDAILIAAREATGQDPDGSLSLATSTRQAQRSMKSTIAYDEGEQSGDSLWHRCRHVDIRLALDHVELRDHPRVRHEICGAFGQC